MPEARRTSRAGGVRERRATARRVDTHRAHEVAENFFRNGENKNEVRAFSLLTTGKMRIFSPFQYPERESSMAIQRRNLAWSSSSDRSRFVADDRFDSTGRDIMLPGTAGAVM